MIITVAARTSPLSKAQFSEVYQAIQSYHPNVTFEPIYIETYGDQDLQTSLRGLEKTDFFTREIDNTLLEGKCDIAIHSAKDLPNPLREGLTITALTQGIDSSDVLVLKEGYTPETLPTHAIIATSSERREESVRQLLNKEVDFIDLRGTIEKRLELITDGLADGIVVAKAALIRLNLIHLNHYLLPGPTAPLQGKLAIVTRSNDQKMIELFSCIDSRETFHAQ
ncbi:MAG: hydroxymethylbilane synthase [Parachlamydiaceae bacterium]